MTEKNNFIIQENDANQTIFNFIKKNYQTTPLSLIYKLFRNKKVKINNKVVKDFRYVLMLNDSVKIFDNNLKLIKRENFSQNQYQNNSYELQIIYEDKNILVVDKPAGLEMHSEIHLSLDGFVKTYLVNNNEYNPLSSQSFKISHLYRLDKFTRGLVIYPKNRSTMLTLMVKLTYKKYIQKYYLLECQGKYDVNNYLLTGFIYHDELQKKMVFNEKKIYSFAKECQTIFTTLEINESTTLVEAQLITGRKHQIRASIAYLDHPIVNDRKYLAKKVKSNDVIHLCAYKLTFANFSDELSYLNNCVFEIIDKKDNKYLIFNENII